MKRVLLLLLGCLGLPASALGQNVSPPEELFLTVEPGGSALVREVRVAQLVEGTNRLRAFEASPRILPTSVHLRSLSHPRALRLSKQTLWYEVLDNQRLLELLVGRQIDLQVQRQWTTEEFEGRLLLPPYAVGPRGEERTPLFIETLEGQIRVVDGADVVLDTVPDGEWNRVRLDWELESTVPGRHQLELDYRTEGLVLSLNGTLRVDEEAARADLGLLASIRNDTGVNFENAHLQVSVREALPRASRHPLGDEPDFQYRLSESATLEARRTHEFSVAQVASVPVRTSFTLFPPDHPASQPAQGEELRPIARRYDLELDPSAGLPPALPAAEYEVYRLDEDRRLHREGRSPAPTVGSGEILSLAGAPLPGLGATRSETVEGNRRQVRLTFYNERSESVQVQVMEPLGVREVARCTDARVELGRSGWALIFVDVPSNLSLAVTYTVTRE